MIIVAVSILLEVVVVTIQILGIICECQVSESESCSEMVTETNGASDRVTDTISIDKVSVLGFAPPSVLPSPDVEGEIDRRASIRFRGPRM